MLDPTAVRTQLADAIRPLVPASVPVLESAFDGLAVLPAVVIGMPSWDEARETNFCFPRLTWPVGVIVSRPGDNDPVTVETLDQTWAAVLAGLRNVHSLAAASQVIVQRSQFGLFLVQGQQYPSQTIFVETF